MSSSSSLLLRIGGGLLAAVAVVALVVVLMGAGDGGRPYQVRAIFDNAVNVIPGEDVKIAGVKVGAIDALSVQDNRHAAIVLNIDAKGFQDFRSDATCTINAQSLIGEKFVSCTPTRPRRGGAAPPPATVIPDGQPGAGQRLVPLAQTSSPVDPDLLTNIMRAPGPERLRVILNELGVGLAARGKDLHEAVLRADPALKETNDVLAIVAGQNTTLAQLATDSDRVLAPLAAQRRHVTGAIRSIGATAQATAEQRVALAENLRRFPAFLRELVPTTDRLGALSDAGLPLVKSVNAAAPGLNLLSTGLKPFAQALGPWFDSLGKTAKDGTTAIVQAKPAIDALTALADDAGPTLQKLGGFLGDLRYAGGIENFLDLIYNSASATNGFDDVSHVIRGVLAATQCATYAVTPSQGCDANFIDDTSTARSARSQIDPTVPRDAGLLRAAMVLNGSTPAQALSTYPDEPAHRAAEQVVAKADGQGDGAGTHPAAEARTAGDASLLDYLLAP